MEGEPVTLTPDQRTSIETTIRDHCAHRDWTLHGINARTNHIHVVLTADRDANEVMKQLKAWCSRRLSEDLNLIHTIAKRAGRRRWFTEGGFKRIIENEEYLQNAIRYVTEAQ
jgi:REP element-mobilizing transposase RayT